MISLIEEGGRNVTVEQIEKACAIYDAECVLLEETIAALKRDLEKVQTDYLREIKRQVNTVASREAELHSLVESAPHLFKKPRTLTLNGVKVGFTKSSGKVEWTDAEQVMRLIRSKFKDRENELIRAKSEPNKEAIGEMDSADLAKIGCRIEGEGDSVVLARTAGDIEKQIGNLLKKLVSAMVEGQA